MAKVIKTTFKLRRGKEAAWEKNNPVLAAGEPGFVLDKNILKIGDGETRWKDLLPVSADSAGDWNQNDETARDYIKNRPFYESGVKNVLFDGEIDLESGKVIAFDGTLDLQVGTIYTIILDGVEYQVECENEPDMGSPYLYMYLKGTYSFDIFPTYIQCQVIPDEETGIHSFKIIDDSEYIIKQLDPKFIPEECATTDDLGDLYDAIDTKMNVNNPVGTGSFSMNRKADTTIGNYSHAEGYNTEASEHSSHAEGFITIASGENSHAEGYKTTASGWAAHAEGYETTASGDFSHAEGSTTTAKGGFSHAEGAETVASNEWSHAEGYSTTASGQASHAEGAETIASMTDSHAEGMQTTASGPMSHAEGFGTTSSGMATHTEGMQTAASGTAAHAEGNGTVAKGNDSHAQGRFNIEDTTNINAHIVGNGTSNSARSNAHTLDWDGNAWYAGDVYVGSTSGKNKDEGSVKLATVNDLSNYYNKSEIDAIMGSYIDDIDTLLGGDA